jgi:two-component system OmpR family sensor kinase/two-component system sensor histidine kinase BaeS
MTPPFAHWRRRRRPPWWPDEEPWPPASPATIFREHRARFIRRSRWWTFLPIWIVVLVVLNHLPWSGRPGGPLGGAVVLLVAGAVASAAVALLLRFFAAPLAELSAAATRIRARDYRVRVAVPLRGPAWLRDALRAFNAMATELETQDRARRHLMADIAHELRTPIAVLQGQIEGLIDGVYPRDDERLGRLLDETRMLARLVEDLRQLSTAESGTLALSPEPTDLVALANDVAASLGAQAHDSGIALEVPSSPADAGTVDVDPLRIREVLLNVVSNALRHTPSGGRVDVRLSASDAQVEIRVADTGSGISADEVARVFDRFFKGAGSTGSGLGLTIARSLVEAHGGTIRAESRSGAGTTIVIVLPRTQAGWRRG